MKKAHYKAIAEIVGCSPSMVSRVMNNERNTDTKLGRKIVQAARLYKANLKKIEADIAAKIKKDNK